MPLSEYILQKLQNNTLKKLDLARDYLSTQPVKDVISDQLKAILPLVPYCYNLREFTISTLRAVDDGMIHDLVRVLEHMPNLRTLYIFDSDATDAGANVLKNTVKTLKYLNTLSLQSGFYSESGIENLASVLKDLPYLQHINLGYRGYSVKYLSTLKFSINKYTVKIEGLASAEYYYTPQAFEIVKEIKEIIKQNSTRIQKLYDLQKYLGNNLSDGVYEYLYTIPLLTEALENGEIPISKIAGLIKERLSYPQFGWSSVRTDPIFGDSMPINRAPPYIISTEEMLDVQDICISDFVREVYKLDDQFMDQLLITKLYTYKSLLEAVKNHHIHPEQVNKYIATHMVDCINKYNFNFDQMRDDLIEESLRNGVDFHDLQGHNFYGFDIVKMLVENCRFSEVMSLIESGMELNYINAFDLLVDTPVQGADLLPSYMTLLYAIISSIEDLASNVHYMQYAVNLRQTSVIEALICAKAEAGGVNVDILFAEDELIANMIGQYQAEIQ